MRTTNQIICAVKDCQPVMEDELCLALLAMESIEFFVQDELGNLIEAIEKGQSPTLLRLRAKNAFKTIESMFRARKTEPDKWLGPAHTPGTPEHSAGVRMAKAVFKKATGIDLDAPAPKKETAK